MPVSVSGNDRPLGTGAAAQTALKTTENVRELVKTLILPKPTFVSAQKMKLSWQQK